MIIGWTEKVGNRLSEGVRAEINSVCCTYSQGQPPCQKQD